MTNANAVPLLPTVGLEYEFSVTYKGKSLTLVRAGRGTAEEDVLAFVREHHRERSYRVCAEVRLAVLEERPERWVNNPMRMEFGDVWMLVVVFEEGYPEVCCE